MKCPKCKKETEYFIHGYSEIIRNEVNFINGWYIINSDGEGDAGFLRCITCGALFTDLAYHEDREVTLDDEIY